MAVMSGKNETTGTIRIQYNHYIFPSISDMNSIPAYGFHFVVVQMIKSAENI